MDNPLTPPLLVGCPLKKKNFFNGTDSNKRTFLGLPFKLQKLRHMDSLVIGVFVQYSLMRSQGNQKFHFSQLSFQTKTFTIGNSVRNMGFLEEVRSDQGMQWDVQTSHIYAQYVHQGSKHP